jgi:hypothetical protein
MFTNNNKQKKSKTNVSSFCDMERENELIRCWKIEGFKEGK